MTALLPGAGLGARPGLHTGNPKRERKNMARIVPLAEIFKCDPGEQIPAIRGKVLSVGKYFSGTTDKGPWSFQKVVLQDQSGKAETKFKGRNEVDATCVGKVMFVVANNGDRGLTGIKAEDDEYKGKVTRIALVTPSAEVTFGKGDWTESDTTKQAAPATAQQARPPAPPEPPARDDYPGGDEPPPQGGEAQPEEPPKDKTWDAIKHDVNRIRKLHLMCCAATAHNAMALHKAGISVGDEFMQKTTATIFIEACKRGGIASMPEHGEPPVNFPKFDF